MPPNVGTTGTASPLCARKKNKNMNKSFSERQGIKKQTLKLQLDSMDDDLRNGLWNLLLNQFFSEFKTTNGDHLMVYGETDFSKMGKIVWEHFLNRPIDELRVRQYSEFSEIDKTQFRTEIKAWYFESEWNEIYDFIEFLASVYQVPKKFVESLEYRLNKHSSGYRLRNNKFIPLSSINELNEIDEVIENTSEIEQIRKHIDTAIQHLSNRKSPDYRNSIKESITAVESTCSYITGDKNATLGKTLAQLEKDEKLHGALKTSFSALYGWTSDASGIRHALTGNDVEVKYKDAKFMLVACSAFINYLLELKRSST